MFNKLIDWFTSLWSTPVDDYIGDAYSVEYETLIKNKYGIAAPWSDTEEEDEWTK
jgi:hypothetical protein